MKFKNLVQMRVIRLSHTILFRGLHGYPTLVSSWWQPLHSCLGLGYKTIKLGPFAIKFLPPLVPLPSYFSN